MKRGAVLWVAWKLLLYTILILVFEKSSHVTDARATVFERGTGFWRFKIITNSYYFSHYEFISDKKKYKLIPPRVIIIHQMTRMIFLKKIFIASFPANCAG